MHLHPPARRACGLVCSLAFALALGSVTAPAQMPRYPGQPEPDPLEFLNPGQPLEEAEMRLNLALLRVPAVDFARALVQDNEAGGQSWHRWLQQAKAGKKLELMAALSAEAKPGQEFKAGYQRPFRFIRQGESSQLWSRIMRQTTAGLDPEIWDNMLEDLSDEPVGTLATGQMLLAPEKGGAEVTLRYDFTPPPQKRASPAWVHTYFPAPKVLFRSWKVQTHALVPLREPFLLGTQMEPAADGQTDATHAWVLFGRLTLAPDLAAKEAAGTPLESSAGAVQSWTLDLPAKAFHTWLLSRQSDEDDARMLQQWLSRTGADGEARLLSVVSAATALGKGQEGGNDSPIISSTVKWNDSAGFEPSHNDKIFRPCVAEDQDFHRIQELNAQLEGTYFKNGSTTPLRSMSLGQSQPSTPLRWLRWKHAMEGSEADEGNIELAEAVFQNSEGLTLQTQMYFQPGKTVLTSAVQRKGRVQATFVRIMDGTPPPQTPEPPAVPVPSTSPPANAAPRDPFAPGGGAPSEAPPQVNTTMWQIDTPLSWMGKVLAAGTEQAGTLAASLLEAVQNDQATLAALNTRSQTINSDSRWQGAEPVNCYGGPYVNTAPHAKGIYFNMRHLEQMMVGESERLHLTLDGTSGLAQVNAELDSTGAPVWRHWGIWQPGVSGTNATNSGIRRPSFATSKLHLSAQVPLGHPRVVAVTLAPDANSPGSPGARLRWWVMRVSADAAAPAANVSAPLSVQRRSAVIQAVVLALPKSEPIPADSQPLAERLLAEAASGTRPVQDVSTLFLLGTSDYAATLTAGTDYYFTNGRVHPYTEDQAALINAPAVMPPDTQYEDQIQMTNRLVGSTLEVNGVKWKLTHDVAPPQVVTDNFHDVRYEFPHEAFEDTKRTSVSVQRPIFKVTKVEGDLPPPGRPMVVRLSDDTVVVVRRSEK